MATLTLRREDGRIVCERVVVADRAHRRMRGLLGRKYLRQGEGMVLRPGWSIHTAFMRFPIDAVFLDADQVVIKIEHEGADYGANGCNRTATYKCKEVGTKIRCKRTGTDAPEVEDDGAPPPPAPSASAPSRAPSAPPR